MRTSNAELLVEIDGLAQISGCETDELEVIKHIEKLEAENEKLKAQIKGAIDSVENGHEDDIGYNVLCSLGAAC